MLQPTFTTPRHTTADAGLTLQCRETGIRYTAEPIRAAWLVTSDDSHSDLCGIRHSRSDALALIEQRARLDFYCAQAASAFASAA